MLKSFGLKTSDLQKFAMQILKAFSSPSASSSAGGGQNNSTRVCLTAAAATVSDDQQDELACVRVVRIGP